MIKILFFTQFKWALFVKCLFYISLSLLGFFPESELYLWLLENKHLLFEPRKNTEMYPIGLELTTYLSQINLEGRVNTHASALNNCTSVIHNYMLEQNFFVYKTYDITLIFTHEDVTYDVGFKITYPQRFGDEMYHIIKAEEAKVFFIKPHFVFPLPKDKVVVLT